MTERVITLLYHDVIEAGKPDQSGFKGSNPAEYKISVDLFSEHLRAINKSLKSSVITSNSISEPQYGSPPVIMTFDDGGISAYEYIAPMLESYGWRGCFFITTDFIGQPEFVTERQIEELHRRGHVIGSHSCSHPKKISDCSYPELVQEWSRSVRVLSDIVGDKVCVASIPGGYYSEKVLRSAVESEIHTLFTSEPVSRISSTDGCKVIGRFSVKRGSDANVPAKFVANRLLPRLQQYSYWNLKKLAKKTAGPVYSRFRSFVLTHRN